MSDSGPGRREVAYRLFAAEFDDAELSYSESDEERAPNFVVAPTGARVNRLFAVGVLTEVEDVNPEMVRGRVVDPTGAFVTYAGQYQPDELAFLERTDPPTFLALSGKARTFEPDDGDRVYTSVRPESVSEVDAETRDRWVVTAAERTLERVGIVAAAIESGLEGDRLRAALEEAGVDERLADGVALALDYYGTTPAYLEALRETALDAVRVVAGELDEVGRLDVAPDEGNAGPEGPRSEGGDSEARSASDRSSGRSPREEAAGTGEAAPLATLELSEPEMPEATPAADDETAADAETATGETGETAEAGTATAGATTESPTTAEPDAETGADAETGTTAAAGAEPEATTGADDGPETGAVSGTDPAPGEAGGPDGGDGESDVEAAGQEPDADGEDLDPGEFELDEDERREVEEEYGTEFSTADEVESPDDDAGPDVAGSDADDESETPTEAEMAEGAPGAEAEASPERDAEPEPEPEPESETEPEPEPESETEPELEETDEEPAEDAGDVDLEDAVMQTMEALDEGDGADREDLVATVADEHGADPEAVDDAIQDALMSGRCYEPSDGVLKSI